MSRIDQVLGDYVERNSTQINKIEKYLILYLLFSASALSKGASEYL